MSTTNEPKTIDANEWFSKEDIGSVSDGYHTFNELYEFRLLYNAAMFNSMAYEFDEYAIGSQPIKSKRHHDGELCFGGRWFIVSVQLPTGQISNHYEMKEWGLFQIDEVDKAPEWDGHTSQDVAKRLRAYITGEKLPASDNHVQKGKEVVEPEPHEVKGGK